jgi:hypothetical protein
LQIIDTLEIEGKPIPQLNIYNKSSKEFKLVSEMIEKCLNPPNYYQYGVDLLYMFVDWILYGFGSDIVKKLPARIDDKLNKYWYENFKADLMFMYPADYFVAVAAQIYSNKQFNSTAFYPTPSQVVKLMVEMVFSSDKKEDLERYKYQALNEPCMGSGIFLLYASNYTLRMFGQDIDRLMYKLTNINAYLYMPWMVHSTEEVQEKLEKLNQKYQKNKEANNVY